MEYLLLIGKERMNNQIWFHKYRIIKKLGEGGSANVFLAEHMKLKSLRAIKQISKYNKLHEQLIKEATILKNLKHSCIPIIYDLEEDAHNSYIIEQYIEGDSLSAYRENHGYFSQDVVLDYAIQVCDLMNYLYSSDNPILYLDLKPENIIVDHNQIKLIDFGASVFKSQAAERSYSMGTKGYAAPELYTEKPPDERTDIYGVGALMYYMVTGHSYTEFLGKWNKNSFGIQYSNRLIGIIKKCIYSYPPFRYSSILTVKHKLSDLKQKKSQLFHSVCNPVKESICIAIAGTQQRIGTTHVSILISSYLTGVGKKTLYVEKNNSNHTRIMVNTYPKVKSENGIYELFQCSFLPLYHIELPYQLKNYDILVMDYGCLDSNNRDEFLKADIKFVVSGMKKWELPQTEKVLHSLYGEDGIRFLFNFTDGNQFQYVKKTLAGLLCYRVPYIPDPFHTNGSDNLEDFIAKVMEF